MGADTLKLQCITVPPVVVITIRLLPLDAVEGTARLTFQIPELSIGIVSVFQGTPAKVMPPIGIESLAPK